MTNMASSASIARLRCFIVSIIRNITVEPVLVLNSIATAINMITTDVGLYRVMCEKLSNSGEFDEFLESNESLALLDCWGPKLGDGLSSSAWSRIEIKLQQNTASWSMAFAVAYTVPCVFADIFMGAYGDVYGRKYNIVIGLAGLVVAMSSWVFVFARPASTPMYVVVIGFVIGGMTGFVAIVSISAAAYVADTVADSRMLTIRMAILPIATGVIGIVGPLIGKGLLAMVSFLEAEIIAVAIEVTGLLYACLMLKQLPPKEMKRLAQLRATGASAESAKPREDRDSSDASQPFSKKLHAAFQGAVAMTKAVWRTFTRKREGYRRAFILAFSIAVLLTFVTESLMTSTILTLFVQKEPFRWNQNEISDYKSTANAIALIGSALGIFLFKKQFHLPDTLIIVISLVSMCLRSLLTAFSNSTWTLFLSAATGLLIPLVLPCVQSFITTIVDPDEVGKSYIALSIGTNLAFFANMMIFMAIYRATVPFFAGFVYLLDAILVFVMIFLAILIHAEFHNLWHAFRCRKSMVSKF